MDEMLDEIVADPTERISVELKRWLDLSDQEHVAKIIKSAAALRNSNGGYLVIGINDDGQPHRDGVPERWEEIYEAETVQQIVANNLAPAFEVEVINSQSAGSPCVAIKVPAGAISPVCMRKDFKDSEGTILLSRHDVYCRTLDANGTYSSARPSPGDWERIMRACLDNRETDIARFLTRNFSSDRIRAIARWLRHVGLSDDLRVSTSNSEFPSVPVPNFNQPTALPELETDAPMTDDQANLSILLNEADEDVHFDEDFSFSNPVQLPAGSSAVRMCRKNGLRQYNSAIEVSTLSVPMHGSWEVAAVINGNPTETLPTQTFLNLVTGANPSYTYVPMWTSGRGSKANLAQPYVMDNGWQSLLLASPAALNFWRAEPRGFFYLYRSLEDDMSLSRDKPKSLTKLEFTLQIIRMTDAIAVLLAIANILPMRTHAQAIEILFHWRGLAGRELSNWANLTRSLPPGMMARQDECSTSIVISIDATKIAVAAFVFQATRKLFSLFDGMVFEEAIIEDIANGVFERKL